MASFQPTNTEHFFPNYGDKIVPKNPIQAIKAGHFQNVDILLGHNRDEGACLVTTALPDVFGFFGEKFPKINKTFAKDLISGGLLSVCPCKDAAAKHYLDNLRDDDYYEIRKQVYTSAGDFALLCPIVYFAETYSRAGNKVYYYYFVQRPSPSPWAPWMGVTHFDEIQYVFGRPFDNCSHYTDEEVQLSRSMIKLWSNFVKYG